MKTDNILKRIEQADVEWKTLGEVVDIKNGRDWKHLNSGDIPVYGSGGIMAYVDEFSYDKVSVLIPRKGTITNIFYTEKPFWNVDTIFYTQIDESQIFPKYFYYFMTNFDLTALSTESTRPSLTQTVLNKIKIPIPPLALQQEIAAILDKFTELKAELQAALQTELTLREKQYRYYRGLLLTFDDIGDRGRRANPFFTENVVWKSLGEVVPLQRGKRLVKSQLLENGRYAVFQNSLQPLGYFDEYNCRSFMTFIIAAGAAGEIGFSHQEFWACDDCYYFDCPQAILNDRFLYYFLALNQHKLLSQVRKASVPRLSRNVIEKLRIPIPPLEKQAEIVAILDKFDTLTNSLSEGLPREIELREKQYRYYREKLLNFPK